MTPDEQRIDGLENTLRAIRANLSEAPPPDWTWWRNIVMEHINAAVPEPDKPTPVSPGNLIARVEMLERITGSTPTNVDCGALPNTMSP